MIRSTTYILLPACFLALSNCSPSSSYNASELRAMVPEDNTTLYANLPSQKHSANIQELKQLFLKQMYKCWELPMPSMFYKNEKISATILVFLYQDGSLQRMRPKDMDNYEQDEHYRITADSGMKAIEQCAPFKNLPRKEYETWKFMELDFNIGLM